MKRFNTLYYTGIFAMMLALTACPDSSTSDDDESAGLSPCQIESKTPTTSTVIPEITYTEVAETANANDSIAEAQSITTNTIATGDLERLGIGTCVDCDDYYTLSVNEGDEYEIDLTGDDATNFNLNIFNGETWVASGEDSTSNEKVTYTIPAGMTTMNIHVLAYDGTGNYTLTVTTPAEPYEVVNELDDICFANLQGTITNALNNTALSGVTVNLRETFNAETGDIAETTTTDSGGGYSFSSLITGNYTAEVMLTDYFTIYQNITLEGKKTTVQNFAMSPTLPPGQIRVVLTWGAAPSDLDSYLQGPTTGGGSTFTVSYKNKNESANGAALDYDDAGGFGPETITITQQNAGTYTYWIQNYSDRSNPSSTGLGNSGAVVSIYDENGLMKQFKVSAGTGTKWNVFTWDGTNLTTVNTLE